METLMQSGKPDVNWTSLNTTVTIDVFPLQMWLLTSYSFISAAGIAGNSLVICVVYSKLDMKSSSFGTYLGSLALADLLVSMSCLPTYITSTSWFKVHPSGVAGLVMCKILSGYNILFLFGTVSVYTMVAISLERYYAICNPLSCRAVATPSRAKKVIAGIWLFSLVIGILAIHGVQYANGTDASIGGHCKFSITYRDKIAPKAVYFVIFSVQYILPVGCMVCCFLKIRSTLTLRVRDLECKLATRQRGEVLQVQQRKQTMATVTTVVIAYFSLWTPNQILYFCLNFQFMNLAWNSNDMQWTVVLCFFSCCLNPMIYTFLSKQFRQGFLKYLGWKKCFRRQKTCISRKSS